MKKIAPVVLSTVLAFLSGCGSDEHMPALPSSITAPPTGNIPTGGPGQPGGVCTADADCMYQPGNIQATCLPLQSGQTERRCSFYRFTTTITVSTNIACYNGSGVQTRIVPSVPTNTPFASDTTKNEAACVAQGLAAGQCKQSGIRGNDLPCSSTLNPGHETSTWNQTL